MLEFGGEERQYMSNYGLFCTAVCIIMPCNRTLRISTNFVFSTTVNTRRADRDDNCIRLPEYTREGSIDMFCV